MLPIDTCLSVGVCVRSMLPINTCLSVGGGRSMLPIDTCLSVGGGHTARQAKQAMLSALQALDQLPMVLKITVGSNDTSIYEGTARAQSCDRLCSLCLCSCVACAAV